MIGYTAVDPFEAVARFNAEALKASRSMESFAASYTPHSRYLTTEQKRARRATNKRARQARQKHRGNR